MKYFFSTSFALPFFIFTLFLLINPTLNTSFASTANISNQSDASDARENQKIILVIGDSLSAAYNMKPEEGWVALLETRIKSENKPYKVINISTSGDTSGQGVEKLPKALKRYRPAIVIIGLGSNDGLLGLSIQALEKNINEMVERSLGTGAKVLLLGLLIPVNYGPAYRQQFEAIFDKISKRYQIQKAPFFLESTLLSPGFMQADGLHPTAKAQALILDMIWPYLKVLF